MVDKVKECIHHSNKYKSCNISIISCEATPNCYFKQNLALKEKLKVAVEYIKDNHYKCTNCVGNEYIENYLRGKCGEWCSHYKVKQALTQIGEIE